MQSFAAKALARLPLHLFLLLISVIVAVAAAEVVLRTFHLPRQFFTYRDRYLFITLPSFRIQANGQLGYHPHIEVRAAAVFQTESSFRLEYDYRLRTNNLGLVQREDLQAGKATVIVIGDSFTESQGAIPWFYDLEDSLVPRSKSVQLANLGFMGTGVLQWVERIHEFSRTIPPTQLFIIFISDDWYRGRWHFSKDSLERREFRMCPLDEDSCKREPTFLGMLGTENEIELFRLASEWSRRRESARPSMSGIRDIFRNWRIRFMVTSLLASRRAQQVQFSESSDAIEKLFREFGKDRLHFFHVPQKEEVASGKYGAKGRQARDVLAALSADYVDGLALCGFVVGDFYRFDEHPNHTGYQKLRRCLENHSGIKAAMGS